MRDINDIKVSELKAAKRDPKELEFIRKMNPQFANMTNADFERLVIAE